MGVFFHIHFMYSYIFIDSLKKIYSRSPLRDTCKSFEDVYENSKYSCLYSVLNQ